MEAEQYDQAGVDAVGGNLGRPIAGQSLTSNPDESRPFESAPEYTDFRDALNYVTNELLLEENLVPLLQAMGGGVPIVDIVTQLTYVGFREGKWNPDMVLLLIEPLSYVLIALCEKAGIKDFIIYGEEEEEDSEEDKREIQSLRESNLEKLAREKIGSTTTVPSGALPKEIVEDIAQTDIASLLAPSNEEEEEPKSLLA
jgi:hypothetical protein